MYFPVKGKFRLELGRERLDNPLRSYHLFISPSLKDPSIRHRPNLGKCAPQLSPCARVVAPRLAPCTRVDDPPDLVTLAPLYPNVSSLDPNDPFRSTPRPSAPCSHDDPPRRAVRQKNEGSPTLLTADLPPLL